MGKHKKVSPEEMRRFMELYDNYGTYAAVARETHRNPQTVAKYIRMGIAASFTPQETVIDASGKKSITITLG